jgi:hypothetical protein
MRVETLRAARARARVLLRALRLSMVSRRNVQSITNSETFEPYFYGSSNSEGFVCIVVVEAPGATAKPAALRSGHL